MPRLGEERCRSQEDRRAVPDPPEQRYSHLLALALVPEPGEGGRKAGHHPTFHHALHLRRDQEARETYKRYY